MFISSFEKKKSKSFKETFPKLARVLKIEGWALPLGPGFGLGFKRL